jgi:hypothetical protein
MGAVILGCVLVGFVFQVQHNWADDMMSGDDWTTKKCTVRDVILGWGEFLVGSGCIMYSTGGRTVILGLHIGGWSLLMA